MTHHDDPAPNQNAGSSNTGPTASPLVRSSRRLVNWAGNLLATGIIVIALLAFGRQVMYWWGVDAAHRDTQPATAGGNLADPLRPHELQFGEEPAVLGRVSVNGSRTDALVRLRGLCRQVAERGDVPKSVPGPAETRMLAGLDKLQPIEQQPGQWEIYELADGPLPMVSAVRLYDGEPSGDSLPGRRVVCWGLALPQSSSDQPSSQWTLFTWTGRDGGADKAASPSPPLPPGAERNLAIRSSDGTELTGFRGGGTPPQWIEHFDRAAGKTGWKTATAWKHASDSWHARYDHPHGGRAELWLTQVDGQTMSGIMQITLTKQAEPK